jgi:hypothetical protein
MRIRTLTLFLLAATLCLAAAIDGTWKATMVVHAGKKAAATQDRVVEMTLNLKADGDKATGTIVSGGKKRSTTAEIVDGKITGNNFSFTTVQKNKKGEQRLEWRGSVDGNTLKGTRGRAGGKRGGQEFTAKRS